MDRTSEIQELSVSQIDDVSGGSSALVKAFMDGVQAAIDKLQPKGRSDIGQKLQFQLNEANSIYQ
jgi:hypothetical protein